MITKTNPRSNRMLIAFSPVTAALMMAFSGQARSAAYMIVPFPMSSSESRTATCEQVYGPAVAPVISYDGGPLEQTRKIRSKGVFDPWLTTAGECLRNLHQSRTIAGVCPSDKRGSASDYQERDWILDDADKIVSDTGFVTKSTDYSCDYYYLRSETEYSSQTDACASNQTGVGTTRYYRRNYDVWSDGSRRNHTAWELYQSVAASCAYYYVRTVTEYRTEDYDRDYCGDNGGWGTYTDKRTYQLWSDGSKRNYSGWTRYSSNGKCYPFSCFPAGSMVLMADGTQKEISTIEAGDWVMGPTGPWQVDYLYRNVLGDRKMLSTRDRRFVWTQEHLIWARSEGKEWWWSGNAQGLRDEVVAGVVVGLFDNNSIMEGGRPEFANIDFGWSQVDIIDATAEYSYLTEVFEPMAPKGDRRMAFIDGFLVTCGTNQWECDYSQFHWDDEQRARIHEMIGQPLPCQGTS